MKRIAALICMLGLAGCGTVVSRQPPSVLTPIPAGMAVNDDVTDYSVLWFGEQVYKVFSGRAFRAEAGDLGGAVVESSLATGAAIASGSGATPAAIAILVAIGEWISRVNTLVNPQLRATILSEGGGLILDAQTEYFQSRVAAGIQKTSHKVLTPFGAQYLGRVNAAIRVTNGLLAGMAPRMSDYERLRPSPAQAKPPTITAEQAKAINDETPGAAVR